LLLRQAPGDGIYVAHALRLGLEVWYWVAVGANLRVYNVHILIAW
jgi:hypothetical protein